MVIILDDFGARLKYLREQKHLSLRELAKLAGVSHSYIKDIESGRGNPSLNTLSSLARALDISLSKLVEKSDQAEKTNVEYETQAAHREGDPMDDLPEEAQKSLREFKDFVLKKYGKK